MDLVILMLILSWQDVECGPHVASVVRNWQTFYKRPLR